MEYWRTKTCRTADLLLVAVFIIIASFAPMSCNSRAFIKLNESGTGATIHVNIAFAPFFVEYLRDLMGFRAFSDIVGIEKFREFFESQPETSYVNGIVSNDPEMISITIKTANVHTLLSEFGVPFKQEKAKTSIQITQELIKTLLSKLPAFQNLDLGSLFISDKQVVAKDQFAQYIGWALGDYATEESVQKTVEKAHLNIALQKDTKKLLTPDKGWREKDSTTQEVDISLVDILYEDSYNILYSQ